VKVVRLERRGRKVRGVLEEEVLELLAETVLAWNLQEGMELSGLFFRGELVKVELPNFVIMKVIEAPPGVKGDTQSGGEKPVRVETGLEVKVPLFVEAGDLIRIDTRSGKYIERVG